MSKSDRAEKPAKENIQGVEIHRVKLNNKEMMLTVTVMAGNVGIIPIVLKY